MWPGFAFTSCKQRVWKLINTTANIAKVENTDSLPRYNVHRSKASIKQNSEGRRLA